MNSTSGNRVTASSMSKRRVNISWELNRLKAMGKISSSFSKEGEDELLCSYLSKSKLLKLSKCHLHLPSLKAAALSELMERELLGRRKNEF